MSYHPPKGLVNRYWKRPKPRIYECNIRDAERFYKDSYNEYLQSKHFYSSHGSRPTDIEEQFATKWTLDRMNSRLSSKYEPPKRESSLSRYSTDYGTRNDDVGGSGSRVTFSRFDSLTENSNDTPRPAYRARSMVQTPREPSEQSQLENIESRLERIKRLREELGLKSDATMDDSNLNSGSNRSILKKSSQQETPSETRGYKSDMSQNVYSNSAKTVSRSNGNEPSADSYESRYSARNDRSTRAGRQVEDDSRFSSFSNNRNENASKSYRSDDTEQYSTRPRTRDNKYQSDDKYTSSYSSKSSKYNNEDDEYKYTPSARNKNTENEFSYESKYTPSSRSKGSKYDDDDYVYESKSSRAAKKSSNFATSNGDDFTPMDDDDELVSNLKKKFPTSDEILERIKKIDNDL